MKPKELIETTMNAWMSGDDGAFWKLLAEDVEYEVIGSTKASGQYRGRREFFDGALKPMADLLSVGARPIVFDLVVEGNRVVLMWEGRGVMKNGADYHNSYCWVLTVADQRIQHIKAYLDTALVNALFDQGN